MEPRAPSVPKAKLGHTELRAQSVPKAKLGHMEPCTPSVPKAKLGTFELRASSGYLTPSNGYIGFPYHPLVRPKRHGTACDIGPKGEARTHGTACTIGPVRNMYAWHASHAQEVKALPRKCQEIFLLSIQ